MTQIDELKAVINRLEATPPGGRETAMCGILQAAGGVWALPPGGPRTLVQIALHEVLGSGRTAEGAVAHWLDNARETVRWAEATGADAVKGDLLPLMAQLITIAVRRAVPPAEVFAQMAEAMLQGPHDVAPAATARLIEGIRARLEGMDPMERGEAIEEITRAAQSYGRRAA